MDLNEDLFDDFKPARMAHLLTTVLKSEIQNNRQAISSTKD